MRVRNEGELARYAVHSGQLTSAAVKPKLFAPNRQLALSVFRVHQFGDEEVEKLGTDVVRSRPDANRLYGWAEFDEDAVQSVALTMDKDDDPPRHANIIGWPTDPVRRKLVQRRLANKATPFLVTPPIDVSGDVPA